MERNSRNIYLKSAEFVEAVEGYQQAMVKRNIGRQVELLDTKAGLNRVTAAPVFARDSSPNYSAAAMDGIAAVSERTRGASETRPVILEKNRDFVYINTGGRVKDPYDTVIMIEDLVEVSSNEVEVRSSAPARQHIREIGEDVVKGELILPSNHVLRPMDIGALLAGKVETIEVYKKPRVGILPTGSEIIDVGDSQEPGKIIDSNSYLFEGMIEEAGGTSKRYPVTEDDYDLLKERILQGVRENDVFVINAGSSAGSKDFTGDLIKELGEVLIHGVAIKPGKPIILGFIQNKPVIGIPGYPVSAFIDFKYFVQPLIEDLAGRKATTEKNLTVTLSRRIVSSLKHEEFVRIKAGKVEDSYVATPLSRGAGVSTSLVKADGILRIPKGLEGYEKGTAVSIQLMKELKEIENTLVSVGSHDVVMDLLSDRLQWNRRDAGLSSAHVGSFGGILALKNRECHMAPMHILDEETGGYNKAMIQSHFPAGDMGIIKLVKRSQGLMVPKGNPKGITGISDLAGEGVEFVNRQRGSGTRILLDYHLKRLGISSGDIAGYDRALTTHTAVAAAVANNTADVGLGVYSAAKALDVDFIPIEWEDYDLVLSKKYLEDPRILEIIDLIQQEGFKKKIENLGGYQTDEIGDVYILEKTEEETTWQKWYPST
ncbi:molybdopterin biosynthesis protein [Isachenkonia alkalipeptolytica]|uniref:Molybdopterin molybdenumtransferase n=1 Tax=Isachenkonia alkalipeptolytica TaxID=2565777 RepID=A0AA43XHK9_9CLOT|nr:molybdopterin biosynthesis protein [Isachenkonia alkalipeptolytica]